MMKLHWIVRPKSALPLKMRKKDSIRDNSPTIGTDCKIRVYKISRN